MTQLEQPLDEFSLPPDENPKRPDLSRLPDAVGTGEGGVLLFLGRVGERIAAEVCLADGTWLKTHVGVVRSLDGVTGDYWAWDEERSQAFAGNFRTSRAAGLALKLLPEGRLKLEKRKRRRRQAGAPVAAAAAAPPPPPPGEKRRRGRPKGSKNRPKEVIAAERARLAQERAEKKRASRSGG